MVPRVRPCSILARAAVVLASVAALSGCGSAVKASSSARAAVGAHPATPGTCPASVLDALGSVAKRVYREGIQSERTVVAERLITGSAPLRSAVEHGDASAVRSAARGLLATGHITSLRVIRAGKVLADVGEHLALAPLAGPLRSAAGAPLGSFVTSVWSAAGLVAETDGIAEGVSVVRSGGAAGGGHTLAGGVELPTGALPPQGTVTVNGAGYQYTSFPATGYPSGEPLRVYLLRSISSTSALCGATSEATTVNTISHVAHLIYDGEAGRRTSAQIRRVQQNSALLHAVAAHDAIATRAAVKALLHQHIVRLRVSAGGRLLSDLGGPFVLAPVEAPLRLGGRTIGSFLLSIQDDEGYKRLAQRLVGLDVLMYMGTRLVKSTLGSSPGPIPTSGAVRLRGKSFRTYTFNAKAFPSGPLRITVLIPLPYS